MHSGPTSVLMQAGTWNKRCRENRPLPEVGRLAERERWGYGRAHQCITHRSRRRALDPPQTWAASPALQLAADRRSEVEKDFRVIVPHLSYALSGRNAP